MPGGSRAIPFFDFPDSDPVITWTWLALTPAAVVVAANQVFFWGETVEDGVAVLRCELEQVRRKAVVLERALATMFGSDLANSDPSVKPRKAERIMLERRKEQAQNLDRTVSQADQETARICEQCGKPVHPDILVVLPDIRVCGDCDRSDHNKSTPSRKGAD